MKGIVVIADQRRARFAALMDDSSFVGFELWDDTPLQPGMLIEAELPLKTDKFLIDNGREIRVTLGLICHTRTDAYAWAISDE